MNLSQELLRELLDYDPQTGALRWRPRDLKHFRSRGSHLAWNTQFAGKQAGRIKVNEKGYLRRVITIFSRSHLEHRVIWAYMKGHPIPEHIDHKNRNATDNSWQNLKASNSSLNGKNASMSTLNKSGIAGVFFLEKENRWVAQCKVNGKMHYLGRFERDDIDIAAMEVWEFRAEHGFDPNHAKEIAHYHRQHCPGMRKAK